MPICPGPWVIYHQLIFSPCVTTEAHLWPFQTAWYRQAGRLRKGTTRAVLALSFVTFPPSAGNLQPFLVATKLWYQALDSTQKVSRCWNCVE